VALPVKAVSGANSRWDGQACSTYELKNACNILVGNLKETDKFEELEADEQITLK
jgi:hypothetical protein